MLCYVYIIKSESTGRFYCGQSSDPERRLRQHNDPEYFLSKTTKRFKGPWKLVLTKECSNRGDAMNLEKSIKKRGIGRFLKEAQLVESR
ncbi:hypothetical protein ES703_56993 [subsurface metagenome]